MMIFVARYIWSTSSHFMGAVVGAGSLALFGVWAVNAMPEDIGAAYVPLLFGQLFGASSGFRQAADAGHLDAVLVSGAARILIAAVHFALSAGPGVLAWIAIYSAEVQTLGGDLATGVQAQYIVALLLVSSVAWAVALPTGRFAGGVLWVGALCLLAASQEGLAWVGSVLARPPTGGPEILSAAAAMLLCPFLLLVPSLGHVSGNPWVLSVTTAVALTAASAGMSWIVLRDYPGPA